jgi:class 3 adenylate cyclase
MAERVERRLAAVLAADVAGYSRLMGTDEVGTLAALKSFRREVVDPAIAAHKGRIVKTTGDGMLLEFASAVDAVNCAVVVQDQMAARAGLTEPKITFRIGINVGVSLSTATTFSVMALTSLRGLRALRSRVASASHLPPTIRFEARSRSNLPTSGSRD